MLFFRFDRASGNGSLLVLIVNSAKEYMVMLQFKSWTYQSNFYCKRFLPAFFCDLFYWKLYPQKISRAKKRYRFRATRAFSQSIVRYAFFFGFDRASGNGSLLVLIVNSAKEYMVMLQFKSWTYQSNFYCKRFLPAVFCDLFYWKSYPPNKYQGLTSSAPSKLFIPFLFEFCNIFNPIRVRLW